MNQSIKQLSVNEYAEKRAGSASVILLDVRETWELELAHVDGSVNIPMHLVPLRLEELDKTADLVVMCHHGGRSQQVAQFLAHHGFDKVSNLSGGINAWSLKIDPSIAQY